MSVDLDGILRIHEPLIFCLSVIGKLNLIREEWVFLRDIDGIAAILLKICVAEILFEIFLAYNMNIEGAGIVNDLFRSFCGIDFCLFLCLCLRSSLLLLLLRITVSNFFIRCFLI